MARPCLIRAVISFFQNVQLWVSRLSSRMERNMTKLATPYPCKPLLPIRDNIAH